MRSTLVSKIISINVLFFFVIGITSSCLNKKDEFSNFIFQEPTPNAKSIVDINSLMGLYGSNKKIMGLSSMLFHQNKPIPNLALVLKIRKDHQKNELVLKQLTKKNLIILPKPIYNLNINSDSLESENSTYYLATLLIAEFNNHMDLLEKIKKNTPNPDFKSFAEKTEIMLKSNNEGLKTSFNL